MRETRRFRGISRRLAVQYLENLGGERVEAVDDAVDEADDDSAGGADDDSAGEPDDDSPDPVDVDSPGDSTRVAGDGWAAEVSAETVDVAGSISLTEVTVQFEGETDALRPVIEAFARKAIRAGG